MKHGLAMLAGMAVAVAASSASACGGAGEPCEVKGGLYHAEAPAGDGPHGAVVFLHGWGGRGDGLLRNRGLVEALKERGYAMIAPQGMPRRPGDKGGS